MPRDVVTHVKVTYTDFIVTASQDGHIKFWKKMEVGCEFVKHFRAHMGVINDVTVNSTGTLLATCGSDKAVKVNLFPSSTTGFPEFKLSLFVQGF